MKTIFPVKGNDVGIIATGEVDVLTGEIVAGGFIAPMEEHAAMHETSIHKTNFTNINLMDFMAVPSLLFGVNHHIGIYYCDKSRNKFVRLHKHQNNPYRH